MDFSTILTLIDKTLTRPSENASKEQKVSAEALARSGRLLFTAASKASFNMVKESGLVPLISNSLLQAENRGLHTERATEHANQLRDEFVASHAQASTDKGFNIKEAFECFQTSSQAPKLL